MDAPLIVITERIDDIPLLLAQLQRMDVQPLIDIEQVRQTLSQSGLLYVGDSKMASLSTRYFLPATGNYYSYSGVQVG